MAENNRNLQDQLDLVTSRLDAMLEQRGLAGKPAPKPAAPATPSAPTETPAAVAPSAPAAGAPTQSQVPAVRNAAVDDPAVARIGQIVQRAVDTLLPIAEQWLKDQPETDLRGYLDYLIEGRVGDLETPEAAVEMARAMSFLDSIHGHEDGDVASQYTRQYTTEDGETIDLGQQYIDFLAKLPKIPGKDTWFVTDFFTFLPKVENNTLTVEVAPGAAPNAEGFSASIEKVRPGADNAINPEDVVFGEKALESATRPAIDQGGLPVPPQGESPVSVAPRAISGGITTTAEAMNAGLRTSTTRAAAWKVGDYLDFSQDGVNGFWKIKEVKKYDFNNPDDVAAWESTEGWNFERIKEQGGVLLTQLTKPNSRTFILEKVDSLPEGAKAIKQGMYYKYGPDGKTFDPSFTKLAGSAPEKMTTAPTPERPVRQTTIGEAPDEALMRQSANMYSGEPQAENVVEDAQRAPLPEGPKVAIIGTAGWREAGARLTAADFQAMYDDAASRVTPDTVLVSGGAAWADHVAVRLYLDGKVSGLVLHIAYPAEADVTGITKAEQIARYYHSKFSEAVYGDPEKSFEEIDLAIEKGAVVTYDNGEKAAFFRRNKLIAGDATDGMIAYTFDPTEDGPNDGGTKHAWDKSDLDPERKTSIDIRQLRADADEPRRIAIYQANEARKKGKREGDPFDNARRRASAQESGGRSEGMSIVEISESRKAKYEALSGIPKTIDSEVASIGGEFGTRDGIVLRSATISDVFDGIGDRKEYIAKNAEKMIAALVAAGVPEEALRDGFASKETGRTKPFFSSRKGLTPSEADAKNREKAKRVLREIVVELEKLRDSGKLKAVTHPDVAEGMDYLLRQLFAYRRDMASNDLENVRWRPGGKSVYDRSTQRVLPEHLADLLPWMSAVMEDNGVADRNEILRQIEEEVTDQPVQQPEGVEVELGQEKAWTYRSKVTGQVIGIDDVLGYANGTLNGYRPYALDEAGIVPSEWIDVDENGLELELPAIKSPLPGEQTKAHIKFQLVVDESVVKDKKQMWSMRKAFEDFSAYKLGVAFGRTEIMPYTRDAYAVARMGKEYIKKVSGSLGTMKVYRFPDSFHLISETGTVEAGGRTVYLPVNQFDGPVVIIVNQGDPMDEALSKVVAQANKAAARRATMYKDAKGFVEPVIVEVDPVTGEERRVDTSDLPRPKNMEIPEEIFVSRPFDVSDGMRLDPLVQQAVRHTVPMTLPEGHLFSQGVWTPARVAAAYIKRLSRIKETNPEQAPLIDEMIAYLSKGVRVDGDYDPRKVAPVSVDPDEAAASGEPVLILPDENGNYPERSQMIDGIKMSDPSGEIEERELISDRESLVGSKPIDEDRGYRAMREIEQAQESGSERPIPEETIQEAELFETSLKGQTGRDTMPDKVLVQVDPLKSDIGWVTKPYALDILKAIRPYEYNPDLIYRTLFSGFQRELGARDVGARVGTSGYSEPTTPVSAAVRPFRRSSVKPLAGDNAAATRKIMTGLVFLLRYHAQRAKYWNFEGEGYRDTAIISELADDFAKVFGLAYEPNLRAAALMSGFVRRVEEVVGDEAFAELTWDEFVKDLARQDEINSDAGWLGPDMFVDTRLIANDRSRDAINLYREYVSSQIAGTKFGQEGGRRPDLSLNRAFDSVTEGGWEGDEEPKVVYRAEATEPTTSDVPRVEGELVGPEWFGEIQFPEARVPGVPYESKSSYVVESEILKIQSELANLATQVETSTGQLAVARGQLKNLDPNDPRYREKKYALESTISRLEKVVANAEPRRAAFTSRLAVLRKAKSAGEVQVDQKFTVGQAYQEGPVVRGLSGAVQRIIESSKGPDGTVNKERLKNNILLAWDLISTHHATDSNSPIRKLATARNQAGFQMAIVKLIENSQAVEIPMKWGDENTTVVDPETGEIRNPYLDMVRDIEMYSPERKRTVVVDPGRLQGILERPGILGKEQLEWLVELARNNPVELRWDKKTKSMWIHPLMSRYDTTQESITLKGSYGPKEARKKVRVAYNVTDADAERLVRDLGLSEVVRVESVYGPDPQRPVLGGSQYKLVLAGSPINPSSLVVQGDVQAEEGKLFRFGVDYQLRANFIGAIVEAANKLGVDLTAEFGDMIKPIEMTRENIEMVIHDSGGDPIGPMEKELHLSGDPKRHSVDWAREISGYPMPVRQVMYSLMRRRFTDPEMDESTRQLADMIISTERTSRVMTPSIDETLANQRKGWTSKPKMIGYGLGGAIAGVAAGYLGTRAMAGEEEAARQIPLNVGFEAIGALPKIGGPVASVAALGLTAATGGDMWRTMFNIAGGFAGGAIGGTVGTIAGPVGSIAGSVAGGTAGSFAADSLYTSLFGNNAPSQPSVPANVAFDTVPKVQPPMGGQETELQNQIKILGG